MTELQNAAAALGREGGKKRVSKGFGKKKPEERSEAGKKGMLKRWGHVVTFKIGLSCLPKDADRIRAAMKQEDLEQAMVSLVSNELKKWGVSFIVANELHSGTMPVGDYTRHFFVEGLRDGE